MAGTKIAIDGEKIINIGTFPAKEQCAGTFKLVNKGDEVLKVKKIHKTCGCTVDKLDKKELKPSEFAILTVAIKPESISGPFSKAIYVESNDPKQRLLRLMVSGHAVPLLKVFPKEYLYMGTLQVGKATDYTFVLEPTQKNVKISAKVKDANFPVSVKMEPNAAKYNLKIQATPDKPQALLKAEIEVIPIEPKGWNPIIIKLRGKAVK